MDLKTKAIIAFIVVIVLIILGWIIKIQQDTITRLQTIEKSVVESKDLGDGLIRAQAKLATAQQLELMIKDQKLNLDAIKKDLASLGASVSTLTTVTVATPGGNYTGLASNTQKPNPNSPKPQVPIICSEGKCENPDKYGYLGTIQGLSVAEPFDNKTAVPFGSVEFSASEEKPWSLKILPREYKLNTVMGQDEEGRHYTYSKFVIKANGKEYILPIKTNTSDLLPSAAFRFDIRPYLSIDGGVVASSPVKAELAPSLGISLFSYGKTKTDPDWSFVNLGIAYESQSQRVGLILAPANYNVGKALPPLRNLHIGPAISLDAQGSLGVYMGVRVGL